MSKCITPSDAYKNKVLSIPDEVFETFNELIIKEISNRGEAYIFQNDVISLILEKFEKNGKSFTKQDIFDNNWLDVEKEYRKVGWKVVYDKPALDENYEANFRFSLPKHN
jgi:hypothetical protein